jgi:putative transposase
MNTDARVCTLHRGETSGVGYGIMQRYADFKTGEYYHIYNRGVEKRDIFTEPADYERFLRLMFVANGEKPFVYRDIEKRPLTKIDRGHPLVAIGAYVLMPNHFHLLVKEIKKDGISQFMAKLCTGYSMYFNRKEKRVGGLFAGAFKARHARRPEYLRFLFCYTHLNPIKLIDPTWKKEGIADKRAARAHLEKYPYSSYFEMTGKPRNEAAVLARGEFPGYFRTGLEFDDLVDEWTRLQDEELL